MDTQHERIKSNFIDYINIENDGITLADRGRHIGETILQISQLVIDFSSVYRAPRYCVNRRESDTEHSFMLAPAGIEIARHYRPDLDSGLVAKMSLTHDLIELKTGDMHTFKASEEELKRKHIREQSELPGLLKELPPYLSEVLAAYEKQDTPEAIFTKHTDKLLPYAVDLNGAGVKVMKEDFDIHTREDFLAQDAILDQRWRTKFPDPLHEPLHQAHSWLARHFAPRMPAA